MEKARIVLEVDGAGAIRVLDKAGREVGDLGKAADKSKGSLFDLGKVFEVGLGTLAADAVRGLTSALSNLARSGVRLLASAVEARGIQDIAERRLEASLRNMGDASGESAAELKKLAAEMQAVSNFADESIITAQSLLLSFQAVAGAEGAALLTPRLLDMASAVAKTSGETADLNAVALAVGKAIEQGGAPLKEYGISLTDVEIAAIKAATGLERVELVAEVLDKNFAGQAAALRDPLVQLENAAGDLLEVLGEGLRPAIVQLAEEMTGAVNSGAAQDLARAIGDELGAAIESTVLFVKDNKSEIAAFGSAMKQAGRDIGSAFAPIVSVLKALDDLSRRLGGGGLSAEFSTLLSDLGAELGGVASFLGALSGGSSSAAELLVAPMRAHSAFEPEAAGPGSAAGPPAPSPTGPAASAAPPVSPGIAEFFASARDAEAAAALAMDAIRDLGTALAVDGGFSEAEISLRRYTEAELAAVDAAYAQAEAERSKKAAIEESLAATLSAADTQIQSSKDIAAAALSAARSVVQAKLAEALASSLAGLFARNPILGALAAPVLAATVSAMFNRLTDKIGLADGGLTGRGPRLAVVGEEGTEFVVSAGPTADTLPALAAINAGNYGQASAILAAGSSLPAAGAELRLEGVLRGDDIYLSNVRAGARRARGGIA